MLAYNDRANQYIYRGPGQALSEIAGIVATQGNVLTVGNFTTQASWSVDFNGPTLRCSPVKTSDLVAAELSDNGYFYAAWTPGIEENETEGAVPFVNGTQFLKPGSLGPLSNGTNAVSAVYLVVLAVNSTTNGTRVTTEIRCELWNSSYSVTFTNGDTGQQVAIQTPLEETDQPVRAILNLQAHNPAFYNTSSGLQTSTSHNALMPSKVRRSANATESKTIVWPGIESLTGTTTYSAIAPDTTTYDFPVLCDKSHPDGPRCVYNETARQIISYQSIMDAFGSLIVGGIEVLNVSSPNVSTSMLVTTLPTASELQFFGSRSNVADNAEGSDWEGQYNWQLQKLMTIQDASYFPAPSLPAVQQTNLGLAETVEAMFRNITVSLMSSASLW